MTNVCLCWSRGVHSTLGYAPCATKKTLLFFACFHRKTPIFTNFHPMTPCFSKILTFLTKCWEIFGHFGPESPYFWCISLKDPLFLCPLSLKDPLFWRNLSPKDPYIWGAWWHSYVTFICECPPPPRGVGWISYCNSVFIVTLIGVVHLGSLMRCFSLIDLQFYCIVRPSLLQVQVLFSRFENSIPFQ